SDLDGEGRLRQCRVEVEGRREKWACVSAGNEGGDGQGRQGGLLLGRLRHAGVVDGEATEALGVARRCLEGDGAAGRAAEASRYCKFKMIEQPRHTGDERLTRRPSTIGNRGCRVGKGD